MNTQEQVAQALLEINAVGFSFEKPIVFKSGIISPVYVDNRRFPFYPKQWAIVLEGFKELVEKDKIHFDVIAGIETAGIPHSAALSFLLEEPSVFVRKQAKDHGTKKMIEGGDVKGKKVLLIEDHVTTGGSSLSGVTALREAGATVDDCLSITSYEFQEANQEFKNEQVKLHTLTTFECILAQALKMSKITDSQLQTVKAWLENPYQWGK